MQATFQHEQLIPNWRRWITLALPVVAIGVFVIGLVYQHIGLIGGGAVAICALWRSVGGVAGLKAHRLAPRRQSPLPSQKRREVNEPPAEPPRRQQTNLEKPTEHRAKQAQRKRGGTAGLVHTMISQGRYALLLRHETASQLAEEELAVVLEVMDEYMSVVPAGRVLVGEYAERATWGSAPVSADCTGLVHVDGCYLDRYCVSNEQFQFFVDDCGYEQFQLWPEEALPALFEFVDRTGVPAPAGWRDGQYLEGEGELPVVGLSWYEAAAYARWVGKRLPSDAEWTKAGAWPVETSPGRVSQRRYPWGDTFESRRAALWSAGLSGPRPVNALEEGASLGSVYQLIGNVWEWSNSSLDASSRDSATAGDGHSMKVLHGGAFNTYFENQATCHFRSGERPLARRSNIGFRLALSFDVIADQDDFADEGNAQPDDGQ